MDVTPLIRFSITTVNKVRQMKMFFEKPTLASFELLKTLFGYSPEFCSKKECWNGGLAPKRNINHGIHSSPVNSADNNILTFFLALVMFSSIFFHMIHSNFQTLTINIFRLFIDMVRANLLPTYFHIFE